MKFIWLFFEMYLLLQYCSRQSAPPFRAKTFQGCLEKHKYVEMSSCPLSSQIIKMMLWQISYMFVRSGEHSCLGRLLPSGGALAVRGCAWFLKVYRWV